MYRRIKQFFLLAAFLTFGFSALAQVTAPDFTVVVLPDTQYYSQSYPQIFTEQTQWIVDNQANYNIQFVIGEGDVVNIAEQQSQWQNADASISLLDNADIPYVLTLGNHDYGNEDPPARDTSAFNSYFGPARYAPYSWYMGGYPSGTNDNFYAEFTVNGKQYLILALEFIPRDAALVWAKSVLDANPDKEIIVVTHAFMYTDSTRSDQCSNTYGDASLSPSGNNQGEDVWQKLLINYPNLSLVLNGHFLGNNASRRADLGLHQNLVNEIFANYQNLANGGEGWMRIMTFRPALNRIDVTTYSPYLNQYKTDSNNQFSITWHSTGVTSGTSTIAGLVYGGSAAPAPYTCVPIVGATLTAAGGANASATTDSTGAFSLSLPAGNYSLSATAPGWAPSGEDQEAAYAGYPSNAKFFLTPLLGNVTGEVTDGSGNPLSGAAIAFSGGTLPTQINVTTNTTGSYTSPSISVGSYNVTASATGLTTTTATTNVTQGATTTLNIQLSAPTGGTCTGSTVNRTVTICSPANNATLTSPVSIVAQVTDSSKITETEIYIDRVKQYQIASSSVNTSLPLTVGTHRITVQVDDSAGSFNSTVNITVSSSTGTGGSGCAGSGVNRTVTICSPANNATVTSPVSIVAQDTDSSAVTLTEIYIDGAKQYQIAGSSVNTSLPLAAGSHRIAVLGVDNIGKFESAENVTVSSSTGTGGSGCTGSGVNRTVTICSPASNATVTSPVNIVAQDTDSGTVTLTEIYIDGVKQYQIAGSSVNTSLPLKVGTHRIAVLAVDSTGKFESTENVTVSSSTGGTDGVCSAPTSPGVHICQPASGAAGSSPVAIQAASTITGTFARMEVWIDGAKKYSETSSTALTTTLTVSAGTHRFAVLAFNTAGNKWEQAVNATVQ
jgi:Carboxypeptidase regulatory-like domain/Calcineurin-like phosphoesterase/Bacterial Ig domain